MGIPFLTITQKGSPEFDKTHKDFETKHIEGVEPGMIINTLTREIVFGGNEEEPALFIPLYHERLFQEWRSRDNGGGFVISHRTPAILAKAQRNNKNQDELDNGNIIQTTSYFYGFYLIDGITQPDYEDEMKRPVRAIIALTSTQLKRARMWLNMMSTLKVGGRTPPMYSHVYNVTTVVDQNQKGSWFGWNFSVNRVLTMDDVGVVTMCKQVSDSSGRAETPGGSATAETEYAGQRR
jgi:hypothetical protein